MIDRDDEEDDMTPDEDIIRIEEGESIGEAVGVDIEKDDRK